MNPFPILASVAEAVGTQATSWDAPGIILLKLLTIAFLDLLNGFFVVSEFAIVKVRASQLDALVAQDNGRVRLARHVTSNLNAYLSATQLGITLASLGLGWLGEPFLAHMIEPFFALANLTSPVDLGIFHALVSKCASTATSLQSSKPTDAGCNNFASAWRLNRRPRRAATMPARVNPIDGSSAQEPPDEGACHRHRMSRQYEDLSQRRLRFMENAQLSQNCATVVVDFFPC
jgi:Cyclin M transmembrane N-terminal domain